MNTDRYIRIVKWASRRYSVGGYVAVSHAGDRLLSAYSAIEDAAYKRHIAGVPRRR